MSLPVVKAGALAYLDTFAGLVPCKVLSVTREPDEFMPNGRVILSVRLTATRGAYRRGEVLTHQWVREVVARGAVYRRDGQYRIGAYITEADACA